MSRRSSSSTVSTLIHGAASSSASGRASSRRQIAATVCPFAGVRRKSGCTSRTRSTKSRTAGARAKSAGDIASEASNPRGPTTYCRSPCTRSGARLVTSSRSNGTDVRRSATGGAASKTCSKLSSTNNVEWFSHATRTRLGKSRAVTSTSLKASAIADSTNAGSRMAANGMKSTRVVLSAAIARASSSARRVFPTPPGPISVMRRAAGSASHWRSVCTSV